MIKYNSKLDQVCFDARLFAIILLTKWKVITMITLLGTILGGVIYYMQESEEFMLKEYQSDATFYVEYALKENGDIYYAYNEVGWSYVVMFDEIVDLALEELPFEMTKEELYTIISSENGGDYKILKVTATAQDSEICQPILEAFVPAMEIYGENSRHIEYIERAMEPTEPKLVVMSNEIMRVLMAGFVLGVIAGIMFVGLAILIQDVFYVQTTLQATYSIPAIGTSVKGAKDGKKVTSGVIEVVAGQTTHGTVTRMIEEAKQSGVEVTGLVLVNANEWIQRMYYR